MLPERLPYKNWSEFQVEGLAADPGTPGSNDWQLYFKSGGLYYIDDAGSVTGPLAVGVGDVTKVGTPVDNQIGVWTGDGTIEGTTDLTFANNLLTVTKTAIGVTQGDYGLNLLNTTDAAAGAQQYSPPIRWRGEGWKTDATAASQTVDFRAFVRPIQGAAAPTGGLDFQASINGGAYSDLVTILSNGNVGIGTTGPDERLYVDAGTATTMIAKFGARPPTSSLAMIWITNPHAAARDWTIGTDDGDFVFEVGASSGANPTLEKMVIQKGGNVGIATALPGQIFDVNDGSGNMIADGYDSHPSIHALKENAIAITGAGMIDKLKSFKLFEFTRRPFVSADELRAATIKHFSPGRWVEAFGGQVVEDEDGTKRIEGDDYRGSKLYECPDEGMLAFLDTTAEKLRVERRALPEWQRKHLGFIIDDPGTEEALGDVIHYDEVGETTGFSLNDYIGFLHGVALETISRLEALEAA